MANLAPMPGEIIKGRSPYVGPIKNRCYKMDVESDAFKRIQIAGFEPVSVDFHQHTDGTYVYISFRCVCGRRENIRRALYRYNNERFMRQLKNSAVRLVDVAGMLEDSGAISESHLRSDGYSENEIKHIRRAYA